MIKSGLLKNLLLTLISITATMGVVEGMLRLADFPKQSIKLERVVDPILLYKMPEDFPGVDRQGFRNPSVPEQADIITLGDSHTYGYNAALEDDWPSQIGRMTGLSVYNMGVGGHGPLQYYYLLDRALELKPRYVVIGLYLANDIKGICDLYLKTDYWKSASTQQGLDLGYCARSAHKKSPDLQQKRAGKTRLSAELASGLADTKIASLAQMAYQVGRSYLPFDTKKIIVVREGNNRAVLLAKQGKNTRDYMDLQRPEIRKSLGVTKELISRMFRRANLKGAQLVVLVIPSKVAVLSAYLKQNGRNLPAVYEQAASNEKLLDEDIQSWMRSEGIPFASARAAVAKAVNEEGHVYPPDGDDHPMAKGYEAYAKSLFDGYFAKQKTQGTNGISPASRQSGLEPRQ